MRWMNTDYWIATPARSGPRITAAPDGISATMDVFVEGTPSKVRQAQIEFLGRCTIDEANGKKYYSRAIPFHLAHYLRSDRGAEGLPYVLCSGASLLENYAARDHEADATGERLPDFELAKMQLSFRSYRYKVRGDDDRALRGDGAFGVVPDEGTLERYVTPIHRPTTRTVTAPPGAFKRVPLDGDAAAQPVAFGVPVVESGEEFQVIHHQLPAVPRARIIAAVGTVNSTEFAGFPPRTLRCEPPEADFGVQPDGRTSVDMKFRFTALYKVSRTTTGGNTSGVTVNGHNHLLLYFPAKVGGVANTFVVDYREVSSDGTASGVKMHRESDFRDLFRPDP